MYILREERKGRGALQGAVPQGQSGNSPVPCRLELLFSERNDLEPRVAMPGQRERVCVQAVTGPKNTALNENHAARRNNGRKGTPKTSLNGDRHPAVMAARRGSAQFTETTVEVKKRGAEPALNGAASSQSGKVRALARWERWDGQGPGRGGPVTGRVDRGVHACWGALGGLGRPGAVPFRAFPRCFDSSSCISSSHPSQSSNGPRQAVQIHSLAARGGGGHTRPWDDTFVIVIR